MVQPQEDPTKHLATNDPVLKVTAHTSLGKTSIPDFDGASVPACCAPCIPDFEIIPDLGGASVSACCAPCVPDFESIPDLGGTSVPACCAPCIPDSENQIYTESTETLAARKPVLKATVHDSPFIKYPPGRVPPPIACKIHVTESPCTLRGCRNPL